MEIKSNSINENVIIVAARVAIADYENYGCYICQENRKFRANSKYMGFYYNNKISVYIPQILGYIDSVNINNLQINSSNIVNISSNIEELKGRLQIFFNKAKNNSRWIIGKNKIMVLSYLNDSRTVVLSREIQNNKTDTRGVIRVPYTQSNRYSTITKLKMSHFTKELEI